MINIANPALQYQRLKPEIDKAVQDVLASGDYTNGSQVRLFEEDFAKVNDRRFSIGVSSGTSALIATLRALSIGAGDDVVIPANTFIATAEAVKLVGANVIFTDCEEDYYGMDLDSLTSVITSNTRAVIAVHMFGLSADLGQIIPFLRERDIHLIEDCAQAHLATNCNQLVGTHGVAGCFSFYPGKNLGACGEAGAVITNNKDIARRVRMYIDHGSSAKYQHEIIGDNCRMDSIQSAILRIKLKHLETANNRRRYIASQFKHHLSRYEELSLPQVRNNCQHVYHLYVVRYPHRDKLLNWLKTKGINAGIHYPIPCHLQEVFKKQRHGVSPTLPRSEIYANTMLSIPVHSELSDDDVAFIIKSIGAFFNGAQ